MDPDSDHEEFRPPSPSEQENEASVTKWLRRDSREVTVHKRRTGPKLLGGLLGAYVKEKGVGR